MSKLSRLKCAQRICYDLSISGRITAQLCAIVMPLLLLAMLMVTGLWLRRREDRSWRTTTDPMSYYTTEPIDAVYTWVNGSDPVFIESVRMHHKRTQLLHEYDATRFHDKGELKYSLRSLAKYAPWIRHIYIVTNGQIPHWLNLEHDGITVISHADLCTSDGTGDTDDIATMLPTFSSAAIETLLHRIPSLSQRFLYLNDDVYIGMPIYPDDLYTHSGGVTVFTAWNVPDCAIDCPWSYIGDGSCDAQCNTEPCQYDGGDCLASPRARMASTSIEYESFFVDIPKVIGSPAADAQPHSVMAKPTGHSNNSNENHTPDRIKRTVDAFNRRWLRKQRLQRRHQNTTTSVVHVLRGRASAASDLTDLFASSLVHTNRVLNAAYGFRQRRVIGHVGFLLDRHIVTELLAAHRLHFARTRGHRFRHANDMQFAFAYYHHMMETQQPLRDVADIFDEFDTDRSGTWSDREVRTLLTRIYALPLSWGAVRYFEDIVTNCTVVSEQQQQQQQQQGTTAEPSQPTLLYERYQDSSIPHISKEIIVQCPPLVDALQHHFGHRPKYRFTVNTKTSMHSNFKMLTSNVTHVVEALDQLRQSPKKFNCINDNLGAHDNQLILALLDDFYASILPMASPYELAPHYRNRFGHLDAYRAWQGHRSRMAWTVTGLLTVVVIGGGALRMLCCRRSAGRLVRTFIVI